ncbi:MAG: CYTH domain-containing protein, partial [Acidimicrobiales bacterium]
MQGAGAPVSEVEVEWQFDALDLRPVERWLLAVPGLAGPGSDGPPAAVTVTEGPARRLVDGYLDTPDWRIGRSGYVLRIRRRAGVAEVTLKSTAPATGGLRRRLEVTEPLTDAGLGGLGTDGPVGWRLKALVGSRPLHEVLEVRTRRRPYEWRVADEPVAEVALDETVIAVGDDRHPVRLRRVEVEVVASWVQRLTPLVERLRFECGLQPAALSKFEAGLLASGMHIPG